MSRITVDEIQSRVAAFTDQDEDTSAISTDDYSLRLKYINMAQHEWAEAYDWSVLYTQYNMNISTSTGNASIALPNDFRKLAAYPNIIYDGTNVGPFKEVGPLDDYRYLPTDRRVWVLGSPNSGYVLRVFGASLSSGASVNIPYYRSPVSLASPANIADCPNADFLIKRSVALLWEARQDDRFPQYKADAERTLANLIEFESVPSPAFDDRIRTLSELDGDFRMGE